MDEGDTEVTRELPLRPTRGAIEHAYLQRARKLLRNGDGFGAQLALERLAQRIPHGSLTRQRKLLEIQVLQVIGGKAAAQRAASDFAKAYPGSPDLTKLSGLLL
jgi:outer membrane protein assembly factor BamD (BamD/ComL family)